MRVLVQRVKQAAVEVEGKLMGEITNGLLLFLGIAEEDTEDDAVWLVRKLVSLRVFEDERKQMNCSLSQVNGELLVISQFTLFASYKKGSRPSFVRAARPEKALSLYNFFITLLRQSVNTKVATGVFGADMQVSLLNDGPVTIYMDTANKE